MTFISDYCDSEKILENVIQPNHKGCRRNNSEVLSRSAQRNILGRFRASDPTYVHIFDEHLN